MTKGYNIILATLLTIVMSLMFINVAMYPEVYITTWKYQLKQDLKAGDVQAQEYYQNTYLSKGKVLFDDIEINEIHLVNK